MTEKRARLTFYHMLSFDVFNNKDILDKIRTMELEEENRRASTFR